MNSERVYMRQLTRILTRRAATIRKWEAEGLLPKRLLPQRNEKGWRYWTPKQVEGLKLWMKKNDMRPGRLVADPEAEEEHIKNLRRPRYLNGYEIRGIKDMVAHGKTRKQIINRVYPRTRYTSPEKLEAAIVKYFRANDWDFPDRPRKSRKRTRTETKRLEKRVQRMLKER